MLCGWNEQIENCNSFIRGQLKFLAYSVEQTGIGQKPTVMETSENEGDCYFLDVLIRE